VNSERPTPQQLRKEADEAERIAATVSYGPDKTRLRNLAASLRQRADWEEQNPEDRRQP